MPEKDDRKIMIPGEGVFSDLVTRIKLIVRLLADRRVSPFLKILPIGSLVYLLFPDILPGPIDDVALIWLGSYLFVELCPPEIVQEHMMAITQVVSGQWKDPLSGGDEIVDAEFREEK